VTDLGAFVSLVRRYLAPHWAALALLLVTSYVAAGLAVLLPVLMAPILDLALGRGGGPATGAAAVGLGSLSLKNLGSAAIAWLGVGAADDRFRAILLLTVAYLTTGAVKSGLDFGNYLLAYRIRMKTRMAMQLDLFRHLLGLSLTFFARRKSGELVSRLEEDTRGATEALEPIVVTVLTAPALIVVYGVLLVRTSPRLVVAAGVAAILHYGVTRAIRAPFRRYAGFHLAAVADRVARFQETITNIRVVKSFGAERVEAGRLRAVLDDGLRVHWRRGIYKHVQEPSRGIVNYFVEASILLLAAHELLAGRLGAPAFFLFLYVGRAAIVQIGQFAAALTNVNETLAASARVAELLGRAPDLTDGSEAIDGFRDRIRLRDVCFHYGGEPVLDRVTFEIRRGEVVAVVGPSGSGKSTLVDLLLRFHDPVAGTIEIDGRDLRRLRQASYRRLFGVVPQEPLLFNTTVRDNIAYGRPDLSEATIVRAAQVANAHGFIEALPEGYGTLVGDRGIRLSGGQRQRIAIARAIVSRPSILVLDEATSSLDTESERLVQEAIDRVIRDATSVIIAHRLSTVLHADRIIVLNRGRIEAVGSHAALLGASETYTRLYRHQFAEVESLAGREGARE
jgi:subfamily B ATP-binding cassette protein MsbA